jgi:hypothetical protein
VFHFCEFSQKKKQLAKKIIGRYKAGWGKHAVFQKQNETLIVSLFI